jgi:benzoyl-CoA-dihydrodiol lyase
LVDEAPPRAKFDEAVKRRLAAMVDRSKRRKQAAMRLLPLEAVRNGHETKYEFVTMTVDPAKRTAELEVRAPSGPQPQTPEELAKVGCGAWAVKAFRELDDALLDLRFNHPNVGVVALKTRGDGAAVLAVDKMLASFKDDGLVRETTLLIKRVLKRLDHTARSFFALADEGSCFAGTLLELAMASDRLYMLDNPDADVKLQVSSANAGMFPMANGLSRLQSRFLREPERVSRALEHTEPFDAQDAVKAGLVTLAPDDIDWDDEVRIAIEERASISPDALTGMEANLRYGGPETLETKIFGRLSAWQNWIFQRPNAVGEKGALTLYGKPERPEFDFRRT